VAKSSKHVLSTLGDDQVLGTKDAVVRCFGHSGPELGIRTLGGVIAISSRTVVLGYTSDSATHSDHPRYHWYVVILDH
jgi:hypothetical protein